MNISHLNLALPLLALAAVVAFVKLLRYLLRESRQTPRGPAAGQPATASGPDATTIALWDRIKVRWGGWITWVLPVPLGLGILAVAAWFLAYLGWAATYIVDRPTAMAGLPPWFGNAKAFTEDALSGVLAAIAIVLVGGFLVMIAHAIGKCLIWPELCGGDRGDHGSRGRDP